MTLRSLCIHGHFYQPPREDPFSGSIPVEPGAGPFRNWNERIHAECYRPNAELRNFERISFNIGPTLFEWLHLNHTQTSTQIVCQDRENYRHFGVGNAMAQPYHHTILPLANRRDKVTQVRWGIQQFQYRFNRSPQGMWLPETAVDLETLEVLAENEIDFTILAPWQADQDELDTTEPYWVKLPSGKSIQVFFYDQALSTGLSFNPGFSINADHFLQEHVNTRFNPEKLRRGEPQILLIASDGELYGHHQIFRDLFLARLVDGASAQQGIQRIYPALWLKLHPPRRTVSIRENTSWSCQHGVLRWKGDCNCISSDGDWKANLRLACDRLAEAVDDIYAAEAKRWGIDPWALRDRYIQVLLSRTTLEELLIAMIGRVLQRDVVERLGKLLEAEHQRQKMYTSCAWFFEDFDRIEPKNCLAYAAQSVFLVQQAVGTDISSVGAEALTQVKSQRTGLRGVEVFQQQLHRASQVKRTMDHAG